MSYFAKERRSGTGLSHSISEQDTGKTDLDCSLQPLIDIEERHSDVDVHSLLRIHAITENPLRPRKCSAL